MTDHGHTQPADWRARITALAGGDSIEHMLRWAARKGDARTGWVAKVECDRQSGFFYATVYRADIQRWSRGHYDRADPTAALARAILDAVEMDEGPA